MTGAAATSSLHTDEGRAAVAAAMAEPDPGSLAAATRLRRSFPAAVAAEALAQATLRRRARTKFGDAADRLWFTADALEQATRPAVARWRAERLRAEGIARVVDLGCGIGTDALAFLAAGLDVVAVELDPVTAQHAAANLGTAVEPAAAGAAPVEAPGGPASEALATPSARVIAGDAVALAPSLLAGAGPRTCVFVDPARRTDRGRTWNVEAFTPPWPFVMDLLAAGHSTVVKLGPGVPRNLLPDDVEATWVSERGDVVECSLWHTPGATPGRSALLLPEQVTVRGGGAALPVAPLGCFLIEANGAITRAGALDALADGLWLLDAEVAYLSSDEPVTHPGATSFEVLDVMDFNPKVLRAWVRDERIGTLEVKKRAVDLDPADLRRSLRPKGPNSATLVIARTTDGTRALHVRRLAR